MAMSGTSPKFRVTSLEASYSGRALTVRCEVAPADPSHAISLLLLRVDDPNTGNIYLNPVATPNYGTPPPAGASQIHRRRSRTYSIAKIPAMSKAHPR